MQTPIYSSCMGKLQNIIKQKEDHQKNISDELSSVKNNNEMP